MDAIRAIGNTVAKQTVQPSGSFRIPEAARTKEPRPEQERQAEKIVQFLQENLGGFNVKFQYSFSKPTGITVVKVINGDSGEVVREIPPKELVALAESIAEQLHGLLYDENI